MDGGVESKYRKLSVSVSNYCFKNKVNSPNNKLGPVSKQLRMQHFHAPSRRVQNTKDSIKGELWHTAKEGWLLSCWSGLTPDRQIPCGAKH